MMHLLTPHQLQEFILSVQRDLAWPADPDIVDWSADQQIKLADFVLKAQADGGTELVVEAVANMNAEDLNLFKDGNAFITKLKNMVYLSIESDVRIELMYLIHFTNRVKE